MKNAVHALEHIAGIPASHGHVAHGVPRLLGGELGGGPQLLRLGGQGCHLLGVGLGECFYIGHGCLKVARQAYTLYVGLCDFLQGYGNTSSGDGVLDRAECLNGFLTETGRAFGGPVLLRL